MPDKRQMNKEEKKITKELAHRQPVSGAFDTMKGDIEHGDVLIDVKTKIQGATQFTVTVNEIDKVRREACTQEQQIGVILINMMKTHRRFYIIDADDFELYGR